MIANAHVATGEIRKVRINATADAKARALRLVRNPASRVYRVTFVDPLAGGRVLWDTYDVELDELLARPAAVAS